MSLNEIIRAAEEQGNNERKAAEVADDVDPQEQDRFNSRQYQPQR